jgi:hypothetical protein
LSIIYDSKHPKKGGIQGTKKEGPTSKKTKGPSKKGQTIRNIKFPNSLVLQEAHQIMKGEDPLKERLA